MGGSGGAREPVVDRWAGMLGAVPPAPPPHPGGLARPRPGARRLVALWLVAAAVAGGLLLAAQRARGPLDDPDPAYQRPGFLDAGDLPRPAPALPDGLPRAGRRAVVFFAPADRLARLCGALAGRRFGPQVDVAVVVPQPATCAGVATVVDGGGGLAAAYGLRPTRQGGPPEGYAVVDGAGRVRYATLDPAVAGHLAEVDTIVAATP